MLPEKRQQTEKLKILSIYIYYIIHIFKILSILCRKANNIGYIKRSFPPYVIVRYTKWIYVATQHSSSFRASAWFSFGNFIPHYCTPDGSINSNICVQLWKPKYPWKAASKAEYIPQAQSIRHISLEHHILGRIYAKTFLLSFCFCLWQYWGCTQGFALARQILYHWVAWTFQICLVLLF
jgi:hypothetical protein